VLENLKLAFGVFISGDVNIARRLISEKTKLRNAELLAAERHLARLREGRRESIESSSLHIDVLCDLKRIHSHICSVAYPVLERAGELHPNRLRSPDAEEKAPDSAGGEARAL
jgi:phosphate:Na+ symporter